MNYWLIPTKKVVIKRRWTITNINEGVEELEPSYVTGRIIKWCSHCGKRFCQLCRRLTMELPYDPAIPLLSIHQRELKHMHKHLYVFYFYIHENIVHYIPKLKRTQKSIN